MNTVLKNFLLDKKVQFIFVVIFACSIICLLAYMILKTYFSSSTLPSISLIETNQNFPILVDSNDEYQGRIIENDKYYRQGVSNVISRILKEGDIAIDVGAGYGYHSILMSKIVGSGGQVYTFEYSMPLYKILTYNLLINELDNTFPSNKVLYSSQTIAYLDEDKKYLTNSTLFTDSSSLKQHKEHLVKTDTLDCVLNNITTVKLINLNTNRNDLSILMGASEIISHSKDLSIILNWNMSEYQNLGDQVHHLIDNFYKAKYEFWLIDYKGDLKLLHHDQLIKINQGVDILITRLDV